jgi:branched-chain amino acid transport system ATP-binding protein
MDMVTRLCSRALVMVEGRLLCEGAPREVTRDQRVIDAYLGAPLKAVGA